MRLHLWAEFQNYKLHYTNVILHTADQPWSSCPWTPGTTDTELQVAYILALDNRPPTTFWDGIANINRDPHPDQYMLQSHSDE